MCDKTGTLTDNVMKVKAFCVAGITYDFDPSMNKRREEV